MTYARKWEAEEKAEHPAPEVPCRLAEPYEVPAGASRMSGRAQSSGWLVVFTYCRGTTVTVRSAPKIVDSLALRMRRDGRRAVAIWVDGYFEFGARWGADVALQPIGERNLTKWLAS